MNWARFLVCTTVFALVMPAITSAATLYIEPPVSELMRGDSLTMQVRLDTDEAAGECINAVDAIITYPENIAPVDASIGGSIFSMWVERPQINKDARTITFAGGIPNGYCGRVDGDPRLTNELAEIVFRSPGFVVGKTESEDAVAEIAFAPETTAYLNDGFGSKAQLQTYPAKIALNPAAGTGVNNQWREAIREDSVPPEEFSVFLEQRAVSDEYFIVFNTTDKQTGIDSYQVMEEPLSQFGSFRWGEATAPWIQATSPHTLEDQSLNSIIRVKAIDKAGNEYIANLIPDESLRSLSQAQLMTYLLAIFGVVLFLALAITGWVLIRRRRALAVQYRETPEDENAEPDNQADS